jgi:hypothetical protein
MAIDAAGKRLFVAELSNGTVDIVDLQAGKAVNRVRNLNRRASHTSPIKI